jgi:hypothetical protein
MPASMPPFAFRSINFQVGTYDPPVLGTSNKNTQFTVSLLVDWQDQKDAMVALVGSVSVVGRQIRRVLPHCWGEVDTRYPFLYCTEVVSTAKGTGKDHSATKALLKATYGILPYQLKEDADIEHDVDDGYLERYVEVMPSAYTSSVKHGQGQAFCYANNRVNGARPNARLSDDVVDIGRPVLIGDPFVENIEIMTYLWHDVPMASVNWEYIRECQNCMNNAPFGVYYDQRASRSMLLTAVHHQRTFSATGVELASVRFVFKYRQQGWDRVPDPLYGNQYFTVLSIRDGVSRMFREKDFREMFRPKPP